MCTSEGADNCASEGGEGVKECASEGTKGVCPRGCFQQRGRNKECTGEGAVHAPARTLKECASEGADRARKSHCHVFLGGLDPGQAPLKTLLLMLRRT